MIKKIFIFGFFIFLTNCSGAGTALLGPTFTGVKTGSIYQTSLSYGSGKVVDTIKNKINENVNKINELALSKSKEILKKTPTLVALKTHKIIVSDPIIEEPLP